MVAMQDPGATLYRRRKVVLAIVVGAVALVGLCLLVLHTIKALAPLVGAMG